MATIKELFETGLVVEVHAMGRWYRGQVVKVGGRRVVVEYTSGAGVTRLKSVGPDKVRTITGDQAVIAAAPTIKAGAAKGAAKRMFRSRVDCVAKGVVSTASDPAVTTWHPAWYRDAAKTEAQQIAEREASYVDHIAEAVTNLVHLAHDAGLVEREAA